MKREEDLGYWKERTRRFGGASVGWACNERMIRWDNFLRERAIARLVTIRPGMRVLDAGTAAGYWAIRFALAGADVTGLDFNEDILQIAEANGRQAGVEVEWIRSALEEADLPPATFDLALSVTCLQHIAEPARQEEAVRRIIRSLRPEGIFVLLEDTVRDDFQGAGYILAHSQKGWIDLIESQGARILDYRGVSFLRFRTRRVPPVLWARIDSVLGRIARLRSRATVTAFAFGVQK